MKTKTLMKYLVEYLTEKEWKYRARGFTLETAEENSKTIAESIISSVGYDRIHSRFEKFIDSDHQRKVLKWATDEYGKIVDTEGEEKWRRQTAIG